MNTASNRRRIAGALEVQWTPALAARTRRRVVAAIARRRRQRRAAVIGLALLALGGVSFAFVRGRELLRRPRTPIAAAGPRPKMSSTALVAPPAPADTVPGPPAAVTVPRAQPASGVRRRHLASRPPAATAPAPTVSSLFAAADAARIAGRPADAVAPLTAILDRFPGDRRAALAAFELGRVLADDLHDPVTAARAFARARDLDPGGPLAAAAAARARETQAVTHEGATP